MYDCVECGAVITNPLGEQRLMLHYGVWLADKDEDLFARYSNEHMLREPGFGTKTICVVTKTLMDVCSRCVATQFIDWLIDVQADALLVEEALDLFLYERDGFYESTNNYLVNEPLSREQEQDQEQQIVLASVVVDG